MKREIIEWSTVSVLVVCLLVGGYFAQYLNRASFNEITHFEYLVRSSAGNLRKNPTIDAPVIFSMNQFDEIFLTKGQAYQGWDKSELSYDSKKSGDWFYIKHRKTKKKGWAHESILGKYIILGYGGYPTIGRNIFEVKW